MFSGKPVGSDQKASFRCNQVRARFTHIGPSFVLWCEGGHVRHITQAAHTHRRRNKNNSNQKNNNTSEESLFFTKVHVPRLNVCCNPQAPSRFWQSMGSVYRLR